MKIFIKAVAKGRSMVAAQGLLWALLFAVSPSALAQARMNAATDASWPAVVDAARKEGSVMLYTQVVPPVIERIKADFVKAYPGIALEYVRLPGLGVLTKIEQERRGDVDGGDIVIIAEIPWLEERTKDGTLRKPLGPSTLSWPAKFLVRDAVPVLGIEPLVMAYNTNLVKTPVTGYQDLLRPEFKGRLGTTEVQSLPTLAWYEWLERTQGSDFLAKFAAQSPRIYTGAVPNAQAAASGEIALAVFSVATVVVPLIEKGAPIKLIIPKPALGLRWAGGIVAGSKRPNASQVLMDFLMSPRGQAAWHSRGDSASPLPNIPGSPDINSIDAFDPSIYNANSISDYKRKMEGIFKR